MMNFNSNNTLLTSRVQQASSSSHPQPQQPHIQNQQGAQISGNLQKAANMSNQASFPISASSNPSDKIQQPSTNLQQTIHHSQNNNNNNNSHGGMNLPPQQQILQHQQNVNRNMSNVSSHQQINKNLHQMSTPQQQAQQAQNSFHQQQLMSSLPKVGASANMGGIMQQISQLVYPAQMTGGGGPMPQQQQFNMQNQSNVSTQKFQSSSVLPPSLNQSKPVMTTLQQVPPPVQQQMRQNYGSSPPLVSTTNQHQPMQYSPSKPVHPQMKTTAKLASPGSQLQTFQQQLPSQLPLTQLPLQVVTSANPLPSIASTSITTSSGNNVNTNAIPSPAKSIIIPVVTSAPITNSVPSSNTIVTSSPSAPITPLQITTPTKPFEKSPESTSSVKSSSIIENKTSQQPSSVQAQSIVEAPPLTSQKTNTKAPEEKKVIEEKKVVESLIKTPEKPIIVAPQKVAPTVSPVSKSAMRLATVTPPRKKPPPTITKKVTPQSSKKTVVETPIKSVPVKTTPVTPPAENVEKPSLLKASVPLIEVPKTPTTTPKTQKSTNVTPKTKRVRTKVQPYQSPTPELALVTKLSTQIASSSNKNGDDKLTIFYKSEFLAVRNGEGTFYLCQAMHNVYKSSPKIKIRWLNEKTDGKLNEAGARTYNLDFYDLTDIECVLTTVDLDKVDSKTFELPKEERVRIESILKKAIDVEKGLLPRPSVTENNPDGLDLSIYKDEAQLDKLSSDRKRKSKKTSEDDDDYSDDEPVKKKIAPESPRKSLLPRASTRKPAIVENESSSSESDEENLMEIKKKAKSQQAENNVKQSATKANEPIASTSKEVKSGRGRKRAAVSQPPASPEKNAKVLKAEKVETSEIKPKVTPELKASPKSAKVLKKNEPSPKKEALIKEKKPEEEKKLIDSTITSVVSKKAVEAQTTPPGNSKKKNQGIITTPPVVVKHQEESPASKASLSRARNTRSKK